MVKRSKERPQEKSTLGEERKEREKVWKPLPRFSGQNSASQIDPY